MRWAIIISACFGLLFNSIEAAEYDPKAVGMGCLTKSILDMELSGIMTIKPKKPGVVLMAIVPGTPAAKAGLANGDLIHEIDGVSVTNPVEFNAALQTLKAGDEVRVTRSKVKMVPVTRPVDGLKAVWTPAPPVKVTMTTNHAATLAGLTRKEDEFEEMRLTLCSTLGKTLDQDNMIWIYFSELKTGSAIYARWAIRYTGRDWLFVEKCIFKIDDDKPFTVVCQPLQADHDVLDSGRVRELSDELIQEDGQPMLERLAVGQFTKIAVKLSGKSLSTERELSADEIAALIHTARVIVTTRRETAPAK